jgi:FKBP-type peptidyl-prolyl cis-trans isomerase
MMLKQTLCVATVLMFAAGAMAQEPTPAPAPAPKPPAEKPAEKPQEKQPTFAVVAIGADLKVMNETAVEALKKEKQAAHDKAMAAYNKAKKEAEAANKPFTEKAPVAEKVEVKKGGFATEALAKAHLEELMKAKKDGEKKDPPKDG